MGNNIGDQNYQFLDDIELQPLSTTSTHSASASIFDRSNSFISTSASSFNEFHDPTVYSQQVPFGDYSQSNSMDTGSIGTTSPIQTRVPATYVSNIGNDEPLNVNTSQNNFGMNENNQLKHESQQNPDFCDGNCIVPPVDTLTTQARVVAILLAGYPDADPATIDSAANQAMKIVENNGRTGSLTPFDIMQGIPRTILYIFSLIS
jgi:hypothetical protein